MAIQFKLSLSFALKFMKGALCAFGLTNQTKYVLVVEQSSQLNITLNFIILTPFQQ